MSANYFFEFHLWFLPLVTINSMDREAGRLQSMGSQRVGGD